jgi:SAM-dependent methyltransferase
LLRTDITRGKTIARRAGRHFALASVDILKQREPRWRVAQAKEDAFWKRGGVFEAEMNRVLSRYAPVIADISRGLAPGAAVLDVGCGPTCVGRLCEAGTKTYLDPLMDSFLQVCPEKLPVGEKIQATAESIPKEDRSFDVVLCINALDHMIEPSRALSEMRRVLKPGGLFVLGIFLHPGPIAWGRRLIERFLPSLREDAHPYSYTRASMRSLLNRYFPVRRELRVFRKETALIPALHREDWLYVCRKGPLSSTP